MKLKTERVWIKVYTVDGDGPFPVDMMRYDRSVPLTEGDAAKIERTFGSCYRESASISLLGFFFTTDGPTVRRWESFGWKVVTT